jgi:hypothetical protein
LQATCGTLSLSTATVKLIGPDGEEKIACSVGTGPVDAAYKAVDQIIQVCCHHNFDLSCTGTLLLTMEYGCCFFWVFFMHWYTTSNVNKYGCCIFLLIIEVLVFSQ